MVQKEVAERIISKDKKESLLSLSVKAYGSPKYIKTVGKNFFKPQPKVDSAILHINHISSERLGGHDHFFFKLLHAGFGQKRKMLASNLRPLYTNDEILGVFRKYEISEKVRAENLGIETWINLTKEFAKIH